jgi:hypothetical protein
MSLLGTVVSDIGAGAEVEAGADVGAGDAVALVATGGGEAGAATELAAGTADRSSANATGAGA